MSKKIVQILRAPIGGIRKHVFDIVEYLGSNNQIEQIFITDTTDSDALMPEIKNLKIIHFPIKDKPEYQDLINIYRIFKFLKNKEIDLIHGHGAKGGIYARVLSLLLGTKCIYTPHGGSLHRVFGKLKNKIYDVIELLLIPLTDVFLFESKYSAGEFAKNIYDLKSKSIINYNGVDVPIKKAGRIYQPGEKLKLASFGLLRHLKGHDIAILTCALLASENIPFEYTIYGKGEEFDRLTSLIQDLNLSKSISINDYSGNVLDEMLKYDFVFHPSRFESFGYVPVEAMSLGIPVVVSSEGGLKEVVDLSCGYVAGDNSPETYFLIYKKIFLGDPELNKKIDIAFDKVQSNFSKDSMLTKISEIYML